VRRRPHAALGLASPHFAIRAMQVRASVECAAIALPEASRGSGLIVARRKCLGRRLDGYPLFSQTGHKHLTRSGLLIAATADRLHPTCISVAALAAYIRDVACSRAQSVPANIAVSPRSPHRNLLSRNSRVRPLKV
jgi:hypothetical protein